VGLNGAMHEDGGFGATAIRYSTSYASAFDFSLCMHVRLACKAENEKHKTMKHISMVTARCGTCGS
jgi:hypothetical protein